jgi:hypothetical protein
MSKLYSRVSLLLLILLFPNALRGQTNNGQPPVFTLLCVTTAPLESKSVAAGQEVTLRAIDEMVVNKVLVIPVNSKIVGRVAAVTTKGKEGAEQTSISVVIEKAIRPDGKEVPLQTIIAAVAAPQDNSPDSDPAYSMMHSNEPKMVGSSSASKVASTAPIATINLQGGVDGPLMLSPDSQGAIGYEGLSLKWQFTGPLPLTVFVTKSKEVKLKPRTQLLLRMAQPQLPK